MATKNLARTVIEGGRARFNKWARRHSHRIERARERMALGGGDWDDVSILPPPSVGRGFRDKLTPAERYLAAQVGRPWSKVRSELFGRFDTRTTAGRHILFDHLLREVKVGERHGPSGWYRFEVDRHGLLRRVVRPKHRREPGWHRPRPEWWEWLGARRVGIRGGALFWFLPTAHERLRQAGRLDEEEAAYWRALPQSFRDEHELRFEEEG